MSNTKNVEISTGTFKLIHTVGSNKESSVAIQKATFGRESQERCYRNTLRACEEAGIKAKGNLALVGFNQNARGVRIIRTPDTDVYTKVEGNALVTVSHVALMAWASDCCLVALAADSGRIVSVLHASVNTLKNGIIQEAIEELRLQGAEDIVAYVGACAGPCCYEYGLAKAQDDFRDYPECILPHDNPEKAYLDLHGAVVIALERLDCQVIDLFDDEHRCTICAKDENGDFLFSSYRREVDDNGNHVNGQYGMIIQKQ